MSSKTQNLIYKIDSFIFEQIDSLKTNPLYQKITESLSLLTDNQKRVLNISLTALFLVLPLLILLIFFIGNYQLKHQLLIKNEIYNITNNLLNERNSMRLATQGFFKTEPLDKKSAFESKVKNLLKDKNVDLGVMTVSNFSSYKSKTEITESRAHLQFHTFSLPNLLEVLKIISESQQIKIEGLELDKKEDDHTIQGHLELVHFGKDKEVVKDND